MKVILNRDMRKKEKSAKSITAGPAPTKRNGKVYATGIRSGKGKKKSIKNVVKRVRERKRRCPVFGVNLYKVLKQLHPRMAITYRSISIMDHLMFDIFERLATEASGLLRYSKMTTLSSRDIQSAVKLVLPGDLAKHAITEGTKAILKYTTSIY